MDGLENSLDDTSADGSTEFPDRVSQMELRLQAQEDEITLLKSSLADALRMLRIHGEQIPLIKQHLIAVNPAAARAFNHACYTDGFSRTRKLSSNSVTDGIRLSASSPAALPGVDELLRGEGTSFNPLNQKVRASTQNRATQTEWTGPSQPSGKEKVQLAQTRAVMSLSLEDALHPEEILEKLQGVEEEGEGEEEVGTQEEPSFTSLVEEPIQPTCFKGLSQVGSRQESPAQPRRDSPEGLSEARVAPSPTPGAASPAPRAHPLSSILEGEKTPLCVRPNTPH